jgi:GntR family transcriptional regulator
MDRNQAGDPRAGPKPTLWATVLADLRDRMAAGEFAERFPTDRELMVHYRVSRHTVREAVRRLDEVQRRPRLGGQVRATNTVANLVRTITALGTSVVLDNLTGGRQRSVAVARLLDLPDSRPLTVRRHLLLADGTPLLLSELWTSPTTAAADRLVPALLGLPLADLLDGQISSQRTIPHLPPQHICAELGITAGNAVFSIEALIESDGHATAWHRAYVRPDRYPCILQFIP